MATDLPRITELEREVQLLKAAVDDLEKRQASSVPSVVGLANFTPETLVKVVRLTQQLFPGEVSTEFLQDPESPSETFVVFNVEAPADDERLIDRECEWHEQVSAVAGREAAAYRISINPQQ